MTQAVEVAGQAIADAGRNQRVGLVEKLSRAFGSATSRVSVRQGDPFTVPALLKALEIIEDKTKTSEQ